MKHAINQSAHQSINQTHKCQTHNNQPIKQSIKHAIKQTPIQTTHQPLILSTNQPTKQTIDKPINQTINQPKTGKTTTHVKLQSIKKSTNPQNNQQINHYMH